MAISQVIPGPNFSISAFVGVLSLRDYGLNGKLIGAFAASSGIFLPGTFLIFFVYRFWNQLKKYRGVQASLEGINATSIGLTLAATLRLLVPILPDWQAVSTVLLSGILLIFSKVPPYIIVILGLLAGIFL